MSDNIHSTIKLCIVNQNRMVGIEKFSDGSFHKVKYVRITRKAKMKRLLGLLIYWLKKHLG